MKRVTFCGHRELSYEEKLILQKRLYEEAEKLIQNGAVEFWLGGYGAFDLLAAKVMKELKEKYPHIRSVLILAYLHQKYDKTLYDETLYPPLEQVPKALAIIKRNEYMVMQTDIVIAYVIYRFGGASKMLEYARKKKKETICIHFS